MVYGKLTSTVTNFTVTTHDGQPLINGNQYSFRVSARTLVGTGSSTEITNGPAIPHTKPSAPEFQSLTTGSRSITATWTALSIPENGGRPIAYNEVQHKLSNAHGLRTLHRHLRHQEQSLI